MFFKHALGLRLFFREEGEPFLEGEAEKNEKNRTMEKNS